MWLGRVSPRIGADEAEEAAWTDESMLCGPCKDLGFYYSAKTSR